MKRLRAAGFSLVELLVVISIIIVLAVLAVPAFTNFGRANTLSAAGQQVVDTLNFARQTAMTKSRPVEVRFYKLPEIDQDGGNPTNYRAMQLFLVDSTSTNVLSRPVYFATPVVISQQLTTSSLLDDTNCPEVKAVATDAMLPGIGLNYRLRKFSFKPDGSTDLPLDGSWFLTLCGKFDPAKRASGLPANFLTVQIDPQNGRTRTYQP
ncbi:hypothetical protein BH09VER1_BH09VER1_03670 [soil metagenome]